MRSHAAVPATQLLGNDNVRFYFSARDDRNRAQIGHFDAHCAQTPAVINVSDEPDVRMGALGTFDDNGVTSSCVVVHGNALYLYYTGWTLGVTVPFYMSSGLAISTDNGRNFDKVSAAPILDRNAIDPFLNASPWVMIEGGIWRMWYVSGVAWTHEPSGARHHYLVKYAESTDGVRWRRPGTICIDFKSEAEYAISRPSVIKDGSLYRMWFATRGDAYQLGYAESKDGIGWTRKDEDAGLDLSADGWDAEMVAYPIVFEAGGKRWMAYNGNGYGRTGIGLAQAEMA